MTGAACACSRLGTSAARPNDEAGPAGTISRDVPIGRDRPTGRKVTERHLGILRSELTTIREKTRDGPRGRRGSRAELLGPRSRGAFLSFNTSRESFLGSCARSS